MDPLTIRKWNERSIGGASAELRETSNNSAPTSSRHEIVTSWMIKLSRAAHNDWSIPHSGCNPPPSQRDLWLVEAQYFKRREAAGTGLRR